MSVRALGTAFASQLHRDVLKPLGFKKAGNTFSRERRGYVEMIHIQGSSWNSGVEPWCFRVSVRAFFTDLVDASETAWTRKYHAEGSLESLVDGAPQSFDLTAANGAELVALVGAFCTAASARLPDLLAVVRDRAARGLYSPLPLPESWER